MITYNGSSELSSSGVQETHFVFLAGNLERLLETLERHTGAIWPIFPHLWHGADLNLQSFLSWFPRPHLPHSVLAAGVAMFNTAGLVLWLPRVLVSSFDCVAAASMACEISIALSKVRVAFVSKTLTIFSECIPQTSLSRRASVRKAPNLQRLASRRKAAR